MTLGNRNPLDSSRQNACLRGNRRASLFFIAAVLLSLFPLHAQALESGPRQISLLEVYSSEGCSSCPPAEEWLTRLEQQPGLWTEFIPVVFHVDYWDRLGWKDALASPQFSARQYRYAKTWAARGVYTPGFVLNGSEWRDWHSGPSVPRAGQKNTGLLALRLFNKKNYSVSFTASNQELASRSLIAHTALLGHNIRHVILRGENAGKTLLHPFAVIAYGEAPMHPETGSVSALVEPKATCSEKIQAVYVAAWVSDPITLEILQAAGGSV